MTWSVVRYNNSMQRDKPYKRDVCCVLKCCWNLCLYNHVNKQNITGIKTVENVLRTEILELEYSLWMQTAHFPLPVVQLSYPPQHPAMSKQMFPSNWQTNYQEIAAYIFSHPLDLFCQCMLVQFKHKQRFFIFTDKSQEAVRLLPCLGCLANILSFILYCLPFVLPHMHIIKLKKCQIHC